MTLMKAIAEHICHFVIPCKLSACQSVTFDLALPESAHLPAHDFLRVRSKTWGCALDSGVGSDSQAR